MRVIETEIPEVKIIEPKVYDDRGFFFESWNKKAFDNLITGEKTLFVQDNHSKSKPGVVRGLHYQTQNAQGKLARVISGEVFDVAVDVREGSSTYGKWVGVYLSADNCRQLWIPPGFAHGFYVTSSCDAEFIFKCTDYYNPAAEVMIPWDNNEFNIAWPIK